MKSFVVVPLLVILSICMQACTFAPFSNDYTARSLGENNWNVQAGMQVIQSKNDDDRDLDDDDVHGAIPVLRLGFGVSDNFDLGVLYENHCGSGPIGFWGKYALLNQKEGVSIAINASTGGSLNLSGDSFYAYAGPTISYRMSWLEPYITARYNYVEGSYFDSDTWHYQDTHLKYVSATVGNTFWLNKRLGINVNMSAMARPDLPSMYWGAGLVFEY